MYTDLFLATPDALRRAFAGWPAESTHDLTGLEKAEMKSVDERRLAQRLVAAFAEPLASALDACSRPALPPPMLDHGSLTLVELPERLVSSFVDGSPENRARLDARWEAIITDDLASIANAHEREFEVGRWTGACARISTTLHELLTKRQPDDSLYLLVTR